MTEPEKPRYDPAASAWTEPLAMGAFGQLPWQHPKYRRDW